MTNTTNNQKYRDQLFNALSDIIENTGKGDKNYTEQSKALDILAVLEGLLGYTIFTVCTSLDEVRDSAEESYMNIKRTALSAMRKELQEDKNATQKPKG